MFRAIFSYLLNYLCLIVVVEICPATSFLQIYTTPFDYGNIFDDNYFKHCAFTQKIGNTSNLFGILGHNARIFVQMAFLGENGLIYSYIDPNFAVNKSGFLRDKN